MPRPHLPARRAGGGGGRPSRRPHPRLRDIHAHPPDAHRSSPLGPRGPSAGVAQGGGGFGAFLAQLRRARPPPTRCCRLTSGSSTSRSWWPSSSRRSCGRWRCFTGSSTSPTGCGRCTRRPSPTWAASPCSWAGSAGWPSASSSTCTGSRRAGGSTTRSSTSAIVVAALVIVVLGLWDDIQGLRPVVKICGQVIAAVCLLRDDVGTQCTQPVLENAGHLRLPTGCTAPTRSAVRRPPEWFRVTGADHQRPAGGAGDRRLLQRHQPDGRPGRAVRRGDGHHRGRLPVRRRPPGDVRRRDQHQLGRPAGHPGPGAAGGGARLHPLQLQPRQHLHGRHRQHVPRLLLRHDDHPDGPGAEQVVPGVDGDVRPAGAGHQPGLRPPVDRPPAAVQRRRPALPPPAGAARASA